MPGIETLLIFTAAVLVPNLSPGPSSFCLPSRGPAQGPTAGPVAAGGLAAGSLVHVAARRRAWRVRRRRSSGSATGCRGQS